MQRESRATTMEAERPAVREPFVPERTSGLAAIPRPSDGTIGKSEDRTDGCGATS